MQVFVYFAVRAVLWTASLYFGISMGFWAGTISNDPSMGIAVGIVAPVVFFCSSNLIIGGVDVLQEKHQERLR